VAPTDRKEAPFLRRGAAPAALRRRRKPLALRIATLAVVAAASIVLLVRFVGGERFALTRFEISGNARARTEEILGVLSAWRGRNLATLDLAPLAGRLADQPWIERATVTKRFPDGIAVRVVERKAVALYRDGDALWWVDPTGRLVARYDPRRDSAEYVILTVFAIVALVKVYAQNPPGSTHVQWSWFNPFQVPSLNAFVAGVLLAVFIYWGWDSGVTVNEETEDHPDIYVCRGFTQSWPEFWKTFSYYG